MNKRRRRRTFSDLELLKAVKADQERRAKELREQKADAKPRRPVYVPTAGPSLRDLLRRRLEDYGARGRTVAAFARSPWIGGSPKREIDNARREPC